MISSSFSQMRDDSQIIYASHRATYNHFCSASYMRDDFHASVASHTLSENQTSLASQTGNDSQAQCASHVLFDIQWTNASHRLGDNQESLASHQVSVLHNTYASLTHNDFHLFIASQLLTDNQKFCASQPQNDFRPPYASHGQLRDKVSQAQQEGLLTEQQEEKIDELFAILGESKSLERAWKDQMHDYLRDNVIFKEFLSEIRGIGPVLSAKLLKAFGDCRDYDTVSSLWCHTGNHTVASDADQSRKAPKRHEGQRFNPDLRTLTWKVSDCLMKNNRGVYRECYDTTKHREMQYLENNNAGATVENEYGDTKTVVESKGHAHNRALRKCRKLFLSHYWEASRELTGQETRDPYAHGKLNHDNKIDWKRALEVERQQ